MPLQVSAAHLNFIVTGDTKHNFSCLAYYLTKMAIPGSASRHCTT